MADSLVVYKQRTNIFEFIFFGQDLSQDVLTSQIRRGQSSNSHKIAEFDIRPRTDGKDGRYIFTIDDSELENIPDVVGWLDIKRVSGGEPLAVLESPIPVTFQRALVD